MKKLAFAFFVVLFILLVAATVGWLAGRDAAIAEIQSADHWSVRQLPQNLAGRWVIWTYDGHVIADYATEEEAKTEKARIAKLERN